MLLVKEWGYARGIRGIAIFDKVARFFKILSFLAFCKL